MYQNYFIACYFLTSFLFLFSELWSVAICEPQNIQSFIFTQINNQIHLEVCGSLIISIKIVSSKGFVSGFRRQQIKETKICHILKNLNEYIYLKTVLQFLLSNVLLLNLQLLMQQNLFCSVLFELNCCLFIFQCRNGISCFPLGMPYKKKRKIIHETVELMHVDIIYRSLQFGLKVLGWSGL